MKKFVFLIVCVSMLFGSVYAQTRHTANTKIYYAVDKKPFFPGGNQARLAFFARHIRYPQDALNNHITGKVYASFIVEPDGSISHIKILKGLGYGCDAEFKRLILLMPKWKPGIVGGKPVRSYVTQVISFRMEGSVSQEEKIYTRVDSLPVFAVGKAGIEHFLISHLWYPKRTVKRQVVDTVFVSFVVERDCRIKHLKLIRPKAKKDAYNYEALRVVSLLPVLHPAILHGKPVPVKLYVPVVFDHKNVDMKGGHYKTVEYNFMEYKYFVPKGHLPVIYVPGEKDTTRRIYTHKKLDKMPQFPGGLSHLMHYLTEHIKYPAAALDKGCSGTVVLSFVVETDGSISNIKVLMGVCPLLNTEAVKVVEGMPKWVPGRLKGKPVRVSFNLPVRFSIN